jgi:hypothetical protein
MVREIWQRTGLTKISALRANGARRWGSNPHGGPQDLASKFRDLCQPWSQNRLQRVHGRFLDP